MNKQLLQAAQQRVSAANFDSLDQPIEVVKFIMGLFPGLQYKLIKQPLVAIGVYEWDDLDADEEKVKEALTKAGLTFEKENEDVIHFNFGDDNTYFVAFCHTMGVVMVGST